MVFKSNLNSCNTIMHNHLLGSEISVYYLNNENLEPGLFSVSIRPMGKCFGRIRMSNKDCNNNATSKIKSSELTGFQFRHYYAL